MTESRRLSLEPCKNTWKKFKIDERAYNDFGYSFKIIEIVCLWVPINSRWRVASFLSFWNRLNSVGAIKRLLLFVSKCHGKNLLILIPNTMQNKSQCLKWFSVGWELRDYSTTLAPLIIYWMRYHIFSYCLYNSLSQLTLTYKIPQ